MIYLNGDFDGGSTNFVDETQTLHKVKKNSAFIVHNQRDKTLITNCLILVEN